MFLIFKNITKKLFFSLHNYVKASMQSTVLCPLFFTQNICWRSLHSTTQTCFTPLLQLHSTPLQGHSIVYSISPLLDYFQYSTITSSAMINNLVYIYISISPMVR